MESGSPRRWPCSRSSPDQVTIVIPSRCPARRTSARSEGSARPSRTEAIRKSVALTPIPEEEVGVVRIASVRSPHQTLDVRKLVVNGRRPGGRRLIELRRGSDHRIARNPPLREIGCSQRGEREIALRLEYAVGTGDHPGCRSRLPSCTYGDAAEQGFIRDGVEGTPRVEGGHAASVGIHDRREARGASPRHGLKALAGRSLSWMRCRAVPDPRILGLGAARAAGGFRIGLVRVVGSPTIMRARKRCRCIAETLLQCTKK